MGRRSPKVAALAALPDLQTVAQVAPTAPIRLDLGSGTTKRDGFITVDIRQFGGVDVICDLAHARWPWADNSVDEVICAHLLEHLTPDVGVDPGGRRHFMNELYRILKPNPPGKLDYKATIVTPHWASTRAYGDPTHVWPPVAEMTFFYYSAAWRAMNAPHLEGYTCDFEVVQPTYTLHPALQTRAVEHQQERLTWAKEACQDMIQVLLKREAPKAP
jgi:hypothetical protein